MLPIFESSEASNFNVPVRNSALQIQGSDRSDDIPKSGFLERCSAQKCAQSATDNSCNSSEFNKAAICIILLGIAGALFCAFASPVVALAGALTCFGLLIFYMAYLMSNLNH